MTRLLDPDSSEAKAVLERVAELSPMIAARAADIEAARRVPPDLVDELAAGGCFGVLLPPARGGSGADLRAAIRVVESVSRADASVGWIVAIESAIWLDLVGLPRAMFDVMFPANGSRPAGRLAGVFSPSGTAVATDGGHRVSGRWAFASGCEHATWLYANCLEHPPADVAVADGAAAGPRLRTVVFEPSQLTIEDTWHVMGLCGTGSHHFGAEDAFVPNDRSFATFESEPCLDETVVRVPVPSLIALMIAAVAIGTAQGALDDIVASAATKVPVFENVRLAANPVFQLELAGADAELRAARALVTQCADEAWTTAADGAPFTPEQVAHLRAAAVWATTKATAVVDAAYRAGGGASLYLASPLQRRLRDVHALTQHFLVRPDTMVTAGAILAGQEVDVAVF